MMCLHWLSHMEPAGLEGEGIFQREPNYFPAHFLRAGMVILSL